MAGAPIMLHNMDSSYTIITQVLPSSSAPTTAQQNSSQTLSPLQKFLKREPKALGTVQIMIGVLTILLGIVLIVEPQTTTAYSGVTFWGSLLHIIAGSLAVSASNNLSICMVKSAMGMNIFGILAAVIAIIYLSIDLATGTMSGYYPYGTDGYFDHTTSVHTNGITGVLLVFSLLQFIISIVISAFTCKATCTSQPTTRVINVIANPDARVPVGSSFTVYQPQLGVSAPNAVPVNNPPVEPPAYQSTQDDSK